MVSWEESQTQSVLIARSAIANHVNRLGNCLQTNSNILKNWLSVGSIIYKQTTILACDSFSPTPIFPLSLGL